MNANMIQSNNPRFEVSSRTPGGCPFLRRHCLAVAVVCIAVAVDCSLCPRASPSPASARVPLPRRTPPRRAPPSSASPSTSPASASPPCLAGYQRLAGTYPPLPCPPLPCAPAGQPSRASASPPPYVGVGEGAERERAGKKTKNGKK